MVEWKATALRVLAFTGGNPWGNRSLSGLLARTNKGGAADCISGARLDVRIVAANSGHTCMAIARSSGNAPGRAMAHHSAPPNGAIPSSAMSSAKSLSG